MKFLNSNNRRTKQRFEGSFTLRDREDYSMQESYATISLQDLHSEPKEGNMASTRQI